MLEYGMLSGMGTSAASALLGAFDSVLRACADGWQWAINRPMVTLIGVAVAVALALSWRRR